jgi:uncharacterized membrane protein
MIELFMELPLEGQVIILGGVVCGLIFTLKENNTHNKNADTINPFALSTKLDGKTIKQIQEANKNDRQRTNTTSNR